MKGTEIIMADVFIQSITFDEGRMEIQYMENDDQTDYVQELRVKVIQLNPENPEYEEAFRDFQSQLVEFLDEVNLNVRNPPSTLPIRPKPRRG